MKIAVCIKQVPSSTKVRIDPETRTLVREGHESVVNPFDTCALEEGLILKRKYNCELVVISMGPESARRILFNALSLGADRAILLNDRAFAGSDTWATGYILSETVKKIGGVSLVICGKQAIDGDTAQVGPGLAAHLGWNQAVCVSGIDGGGNGELTVKRFNDSFFDRVTLKFPAVITVLKDINTPRLPSLKGMLDARAKTVEKWDSSFLSIKEGSAGLKGSPTRVIKVSSLPPRKVKTLLIEGDSLSSAEKLMNILSERKISGKGCESISGSGFSEPAAPEDAEGRGL